ISVTKQKILTRSSCVIGRRDVLGSAARGGKPDVANLVLGVRRHWIVRKLVDDRLVSLKRGVIGALFLTRQANIELRARRVFSVGRRPNYGRKNFDRPVH